MQFIDIVRKYRSESISEREKGTKFEELITRYLMTDPTYASKLDKVWIWDNFFARDELGGIDSGIDVVAHTKDDNYWAIQCKYYDENYYVNKDDMDTFITTSGRQFRVESEFRSFSFRLVIASTDKWTENALESTVGQLIPVEILSLSQLEAARVDWEQIEKGAHGDKARKQIFELRPHQQEALQYVVGGRSALAWLVDQYQYSVDEESGIVNDPNEYAGSTYILNLVLSIITVSVETMKIVNGLPKLDFGASNE